MVDNAILSSHEENPLAYVFNTTMFYKASGVSCVPTGQIIAIFKEMDLKVKYFIVMQGTNPTYRNPGRLTPVKDRTQAERNWF